MINSHDDSVDHSNLLLESRGKQRSHDDWLSALALDSYAARETPLVIKDLFGDD